jgi:hypothetical protein
VHRQPEGPKRQKPHEIFLGRQDARCTSLLRCADQALDVARRVAVMIPEAEGLDEAVACRTQIVEELLGSSNACGGDRWTRNVAPRHRPQSSAGAKDLKRRVARRRAQ